MTKQAILSSNLAPPAGPFSVAIRAGDCIYISGQIGQVPATGLLIEGGVERQMQQALENLAAVVEAAGKGFAAPWLASASFSPTYHRLAQ
jgi:2-iminobutanoate/2-iminopropanoate deaminase